MLAQESDLHIPAARSLKDRRQVVQSLVQSVQRRFRVSAAEIGGQDTWQRARLGFAVVASSAHQAEAVMDEVDRFVWSHPEIAVLSTERSWLE